MKMSDVFKLPVIDVVHDGFDNIQDRYAAHAINAHDNLIDIIERLTTHKSQSEYNKVLIDAKQALENERD